MHNQEFVQQFPPIILLCVYFIDEPFQSIFLVFQLPNQFSGINFRVYLILIFQILVNLVVNSDHDFRKDPPHNH